MKNIINYIKNRFNIFLNNKNIKNIKIGIVKAYNIPTLPANIERIYSHHITRIFRVLGGICIALVITKAYHHILYPINKFVLFFAITQLIQIVLISIIKIIFSLNKLIRNSSEFEVRNSPLNTQATHIARLLYCWKVGCSVTGGAFGTIVAGSVADEVLEAAGHDKIFIPFLAAHLNKFIGQGVQDPISTYNNYKSKLTELSEANDRRQLWEEALSKMVEINHQDYNLTEQERNDCMKSLIELQNENEATKKRLLDEIMQELNKGKGK
uniref:Uncharacterized protein n=1 Tax=Phanerochaete carnosa TaxID=231932 RepID=A0A895KX95_9APHY|nr:hypothetical protein K8K84_mgp039 [Phanerochaete carnosa]QRZ60413.1 hypothetical protein [Phanerochaete carnosa]